MGIHFCEVTMTENEVGRREVYSPQFGAGSRLAKCSEYNPNHATNVVSIVRTVPFSVVLFDVDGNITRTIKANRIEFGE